MLASDRFTRPMIRFDVARNKHRQQRVITAYCVTPSVRNEGTGNIREVMHLGCGVSGTVLPEINQTLTILCGFG